jgi:hypothetical protein
MSWVQIAPGIYINQNIASGNTDVGAAARAAAEQDAARRQQEAAQAAARAQAQALTNARTASANAAVQRRQIRNVRSADTAARRSLQILGQNNAASTAQVSAGTKAKKKKPRTKSGLNLGSIARSSGTGLNISA